MHRNSRLALALGIAGFGLISQGVVFDLKPSRPVEPGPPEPAPPPPRPKPAEKIYRNASIPGGLRRKMERQKLATAVEIEPEIPYCQTSEDGGWIAYGLGRGDPHFRVCDDCGNPFKRPCP